MILKNRYEDSSAMPAELMGSVPVGGREYYEPLEAYGQMSWSPMISESYPGMFWDPATGKMSTQAEIMRRLKWPKMGGVPYEYHPRIRRGFLGMEYPLVQGSYGTQWGYGADEKYPWTWQQSVGTMAVVASVLGVIGFACYLNWKEHKDFDEEAWQRSLEE